MSISRRLSRLEDLLLPAVETECSRLLRARLEAGRWRLAAGARAASGRRLDSARAVLSMALATIVEILLAGRQLARLANLTKAESS